MFDVSLQELLFRFVASLIVMATLGGVATVAAQALGDQGPKRDGRLTVNPLPHIELLGFLSMWLLQHGWLRPLDIRPKELKAGGVAILAVVAASFIGLAGLAIVSSLARPVALRSVAGDAAFVIVGILDSVVIAAIGTALINLVPLPPLLGGLIWRWTDAGVARRLERWRILVSVGLIAVLWSGVASGALMVVHDWLRTLLRLP